MSTAKTTNSQKLDDLLGKGLPPEVSDIVGQAIKEVNDEQSAKKLEACKELLRSAIELEDQKKSAERRFQSEIKKFDKQLGKLINRIKGMMSGKTPEQMDEEDKESSEESSD